MSAQFKWLSAMEIAVLRIDKYFVYSYVKSDPSISLALLYFMIGFGCVHFLYVDDVSQLNCYIYYIKL